MKYTDEQIEFVKINCTMNGNELVNLFNSTFNQTRTCNGIIGLRKKNKWLTGRNGQFLKGNTCWNKDKKGVCKKNTSSFKQKNIPYNRANIGAERNVNGYIKVKTNQPNIWKLKHHIIYEENYGTIQTGNVVTFKDDNLRNFDPLNLEQISKQESIRLNKYKASKAPTEIKSTLKTIIKIEVKRFALIKQITKYKAEPSDMKERSE